MQQSTKKCTKFQLKSTSVLQPTYIFLTGKDCITRWISLKILTYLEARVKVTNIWVFRPPPCHRYGFRTAEPSGGRGRNAGAVALWWLSTGCMEPWWGIPSPCQSPSSSPPRTASWSPAPPGCSVSLMSYFVSIRSVSLSHRVYAVCIFSGNGNVFSMWLWLNIYGLIPYTLMPSLHMYNRCSNLPSMTL